MCLAAYLASATPLLAPGEIIDTATFGLRAVSRTEERVTRHFTKPHVYYLGSYTGCGCGFLPDDPAHSLERQRSLQAIVAFLDTRGAEMDLELFVCWGGEESKVPRRRLALFWRDLPARDDWVAEQTLSVIHRAS